jgi:glucosyl-3-phosphoglycerate synthase
MMKNLPSWFSDILHWLMLKAREYHLVEPAAQTPTMPLAIGVQFIAIDAREYATVVIPALNEAKRIAEVVAFALADPATAEVIVVDDSSTDSTAELARRAGAKVLTSSMLGKGASMHDGLAPAKCSLLVYLDGDLTGLRKGMITDLCAPLLRGEADFVKASFGRGGGRVTELTAKPMLKIFFPEIAHFSQPLGGIIAARKSLLQALSFEDGYGVDVGLLLDAHLAGAKLAEVDIGSLEHDSQPLHDLTLMANEVGRGIFARAKSAGRLHVDQVAAMYESQRQAAAGIDYVLTRRKARQRLLLLDMDGTVTPSRYALELARVTGHEPTLMQMLDGQSGDAATRSENIAKLFQYVHKTKFEQVARDMPLRPGVIEFVNQMRRRGFMVGLVSDSYFVAADIVRRRIFADFAMAHTISFDNDVCMGQIRSIKHLSTLRQRPHQFAKAMCCVAS